eukprot:gene25824-34412_t
MATLFHQSDGHSCFKSIELLLKVVLKPSQCSKPIEAIKEQLYSMLYVYNDQLRSIPISFGDIQFKDRNHCGRIIGDQPWIHVDVSTTMTVFEPLVGAKIRGKITKVSGNHIAILVLGLFNANIGRPALADSFSFVSLSEGGDIDFHISSIQHSYGILNMEGKLSS